MSSQALQDSLMGWPSPKVIGSQIVVPTHCLYPSRKVVRVHIEGGDRTAIVSDGGGALDEMDSAGEYPYDAHRVLRSHLKRWNLSLDKKGWIFSPAVELRHVPSMVVIVANASVDAARALLTFAKPRKRDFRIELDKMLHAKFDGALHPRHRLVGASNKSHEFDYVIDLGPNRRLVLDPVLPDANSINSTIVAHVDIANAKLGGIIQRIVYDDEDEWKSSDLSLLSVGATPLAFSQANAVIDRLAAKVPNIP